ncbi:MAG: Gfo/Idh/MocA family oxidoreductase [Phycisphaerae bacterium]|nr:Gfo/Idh/MocA family oxidoreductase [Phycisphaerae bacterium]
MVIPQSRRFIDYHDLLAIKELDAISVCTPNLLHSQITVDAFRAGKHVLCEKPMAMTGAEAQKMNDAAAKARKKLQIGLMNRFRSDANYIKKLVAEGTLGNIYYARCHAIRRRGVPSWGVFGQLDKQGGGGVIDIGVHMMDLTWWLMGCPQPVAISGATYRTIGNTPGHAGCFGAWDWKTYTVEDFAVGLVRFKNGATMSIECGFCVNLDKPDESVHIVGDKGGAGLSPLSVQLEASGHLLDCTPNDIGTMDLFLAGKKASNYDTEVASFCRAVLDNKPVHVPGTEVIWVQKMINGLYASAKAGKEVAIK